LPTDCELGEAVIVKFGGTGTVTTRVTVAVWTSEPLVPVIVRVELPAGVDASVVTVRVEDPEPVTEAGLKEPAAPLGSPETLKFTTPANPDCAETVVL